MATQKQIDCDEIVAVLDGIADGVGLDIGEYHGEICNTVEQAQRTAYVEGYAEAVRHLRELKENGKEAYALIHPLEDQLVRLRIWQESNSATPMPPFLRRSIYYS